jgi:hypothetical protein
MRGMEGMSIALVRRLLAVALMLGTVGAMACGPDAPPKKKLPPAPVVVRADQATVLKGAEARALFDQCTREVPHNVGGFWDPSPEQIRQLETDLVPFLRTQKLPDGSPAVQQSWRQYAGFVRVGRKLIYVNAFPGPLYEGDYWKREAEQVCAGGPAYYGLVYDPASRTFGEMRFNPATKEFMKRH